MHKNKNKDKEIKKLLGPLKNKYSLLQEEKYNKIVYLNILKISFFVFSYIFIKNTKLKVIVFSKYKKWYFATCIGLPLG